jgi:hypothetical protein
MLKLSALLGRGTLSARRRPPITSMGLYFHASFAPSAGGPLPKSSLSPKDRRRGAKSRNPPGRARGRRGLPSCTDYLLSHPPAKAPRTLPIVLHRLLIVTLSSETQEVPPHPKPGGTRARCANEVPSHGPFRRVGRPSAMPPEVVDMADRGGPT